MQFDLRLSVFLSAAIHLLVVLGLEDRQLTLSGDRRVAPIAVSFRSTPIVVEQQHELATVASAGSLVGRAVSRIASAGRGTGRLAEGQASSLLETTTVRDAATPKSQPADLVVYEIGPEEFGAGLLLDPAFDWYYSTTLAPRPYAKQDLLLAHIAETVAADIALFIGTDGRVVRIQIAQDLPPAVQSALSEAFGTLTFLPGYLHGTPVPSILLLHIEINDPR